MYFICLICLDAVFSGHWYCISVIHSLSHSVSPLLVHTHTLHFNSSEFPGHFVQIYMIPTCGHPMPLLLCRRRWNLLESGESLTSLSTIIPSPCKPIVVLHCGGLLTFEFCFSTALVSRQFIIQDLWYPNIHSSHVILYFPCIWANCGFKLNPVTPLVQSRLLQL